MAYRYSKSVWSDTNSPAAEDIAILAEQVFRALPTDFRNLCGDLIVQIAEFPEDDVLEELDCNTPYDLLGLFRRSELGEDIEQTSEHTNLIHLYRRPIIDYWAEHEESLSEIITHVLINEIGHHFGLSDEIIARIELEAEAEANRNGSELMQ